MAETGARLAIRLLQDAAERGEIDPWDVDVIAVVDGFLDQLRQRIEVPRLAAAVGGSYEQDLDESSEAFLAAAVLVGLKAELLESATFPPPPLLEDAFDSDDGEAGWGPAVLELPARPERHLLRRPVAPPPLQRPVSLGELIRQLEEVAEQLERQEGRGPRRQRGRRYSDRVAIAQVAALAHREKLPETTAALSVFLLEWPGSAGGDWRGFEELVAAWAAAAPPGDDLDRDRVGVFWALLFLCAQGKVELEQNGGLQAPLNLRSLALPAAAAGPGAEGGEESMAKRPPGGSDGGPARDLLVA